MWLSWGEDGLSLWDNICQVSICHWWILPDKERGTTKAVLWFLSMFPQWTWFPLLSLVLERGREGRKPSVRGSRAFFQPAPISGTEGRARRHARWAGGGARSPWRDLSGREWESGKPKHHHRPRYCDGNLTLSGEGHVNVCLSVCL